MRWHAWLVLIATAVVFIAMSLGPSQVILRESGGQPPFDLRAFGYSPQEARLFLEALGKEGRRAYLEMHRSHDALFPALLAASGILLLRRLWQPPWRYVFYAAAILAALADYAENAFVRRVLLAWPGAFDPDLIRLASLATVVKYALLELVFLALLAGLWQAWRRRREGA